MVQDENGTPRAIIPKPEGFPELPIIPPVPEGTHDSHDGPCPKNIDFPRSPDVNEYVAMGLDPRRGPDDRRATTSKATTANPKDLLGAERASITKIPPVALVHCADAMMDGAGKYDPYNWRAKKITAHGYVDAAFRHLFAYWEGEDRAPDSNVHHLGHVMATCAILLDAHAHGCLIDDRPTSDGGRAITITFTEVKENEARRAERRRKITEAMTPVPSIPLPKRSG